MSGQFEAGAVIVPVGLVQTDPLTVQESLSAQFSLSDKVVQDATTIWRKLTALGLMRGSQ